MSIIKTRLRRKAASGIFDAVHLETSSDLVIRPNGGTAESRFQEIETELAGKVINLGAITQEQFDNLNYSHTMFGSIGPWITGHPRSNDYGIIILGAYSVDTSLQNGMQEITYTNGDRYYRKAVNDAVTKWFKIPTDVDLGTKANIVETSYYIGNSSANPELSGFPTLAEYIKDKYHHGFRGVYGPISDFEELPVKQWGYGMIALPGEGGYVWDVSIFRSLTNERYFRQINASSGAWITDDWTEYAIKTDLENTVDWVKGLMQLPHVVGGSIAEAVAGHVANNIKHGNFLAMNCTDIPDGSTNWGFNVMFFTGEHTVVFAKRSYSSSMWYAELDSDGWESGGWIGPLATSADLARKVSDREYLTTEQFNATDYNFPYTASISSAVTGTPEPEYYNVLYLPLKNTPGYGTQIISNVNVPGRLFLRQSVTNGIWEPWIPIATGISPEEHRIPHLASSFDDGGGGGSSIYWKNQANEVHVIINISTVSGAPGIAVITTLPVGYRAKRTYLFGCDIVSDNIRYGGQSLNVAPDGSISYFGSPLSAGSIIWGHLCFVASNTNTLQSQVRMPTVKMTLDDISEEPIDKCMCVVDSDGNYVEFVMVTISYDKLGILYTVHYYDIKDGERLIDCQVPPTKGTFTHPVWDDITSSWTERTLNI